MAEFLALLRNIESVVSATILQQTNHVIYGILICNERITMLEISRGKVLQRPVHGIGKPRTADNTKPRSKDKTH